MSPSLSGTLDSVTEQNRAQDEDELSLLRTALFSFKLKSNRLFSPREDGIFKSRQCGGGARRARGIPSLVVEPVDQSGEETPPIRARARSPRRRPPRRVAHPVLLRQSVRPSAPLKR